MTTNAAVRVTAFHHQEGTIIMTVHARLTLLIALGCTALPSVALAQAGAYQAPPGAGRFELTGIAGYQLNTDASLAVGHLDIGDAPVYGAQLGFLTMPGSRAVLLWMYSDPTVQAIGVPVLAGSLPFNVATHYFQLGGEHSVRREKIEDLRPAHDGRGAVRARRDQVRQRDEQHLALGYLAVRVHDRYWPEGPPVPEHCAQVRRGPRGARLLLERRDLRRDGRGGAGRERRPPESCSGTSSAGSSSLPDRRRRAGRAAALPLRPLLLGRRAAGAAAGAFPLAFGGAFSTDTARARDRAHRKRRSVGRELILLSKLFLDGLFPGASLAKTILALFGLIAI